jgi:hypothetical protein
VTHRAKGMLAIIPIQGDHPLAPFGNFHEIACKVATNNPNATQALNFVLIFTPLALPLLRQARQPLDALDQSATLIDRTSYRHRPADFDAGIGAGNIDKARAVGVARLHVRALIQLDCGRWPRRGRRVWIGKRLHTGVGADHDEERSGGHRCRGGAAERQAVSHSGAFYYFSTRLGARPPARRCPSRRRQRRCLRLTGAVESGAPKQQSRRQRLGANGFALIPMPSSGKATGRSNWLWGRAHTLYPPHASKKDRGSSPIRDHQSVAARNCWCGCPGSVSAPSDLPELGLSAGSTVRILSH